MAQEPTKPKLISKKWGWLRFGHTENGHWRAIRSRFLRQDRSQVEPSIVQSSIAVPVLLFIVIALSRLPLNPAVFAVVFLIVIAIVARLLNFLSSVLVTVIAFLWLLFLAPRHYYSWIFGPVDAVALLALFPISLMIAWLVSRVRKMSEEALTSVNRKLLDAEQRRHTRIGKELHDDIEQRLAMLAINVDQVRRAGSSPAHEMNTMQRIHEQAAQIAADVQVLAYELSPYQLEYLGIARVMKSICERFGAQNELQIDLRYNRVANDLPLHTSLSLIRVLEESLRNAAQHSGARRIAVDLLGISDAIHLVIRDSGIGFTPEVAIKGPGLGLVSMQERLKLVNGQFSIRSQPGMGTTIHACVPSLAVPAVAPQGTLRISPQFALATVAAALLATVIQFQAPTPATSEIHRPSPALTGIRRHSARDHISRDVRRKRSHSDVMDASAPSPAFKRIQFGPNEVDYIADDVTIRHFKTRPRVTRARGVRLLAIGKDVTLRFFSNPSVSQKPPKSSPARMSQH